MINKLILGTVQLGLRYGINNQGAKPTKEESLKILETAFCSGISLIDTADEYGAAAEIIGSYHAASQNRFRVMSKFIAGTDSKNDFCRQFEEGLKRLGIENYYCYSFHRITDLLRKTIKNNVESLYKEGRIENIGVSIYSNEELEMAINEKIISVIQLPYNLLDNASKRGRLIAKAKRLKKIIHCRSVFLQGLFFMPLMDIPHKLQPLKPYLEKIHELSKLLGASMDELALGYALANKNIDGVVIGVDTAEQLRENIVAAKYSLSSDTVEQINQIRVAESGLLSPVNWN